MGDHQSEPETYFPVGLNLSKDVFVQSHTLGGIQLGVTEVSPGGV